MAFDPALFAAVHRGHPGDVAYYKRLSTRGKTLLELGAGYGRLADPLAQAGVDYLGLELNHAFIQMHETRARGASVHPRIVPGDMRDFSLGLRFDTIIIPYTGLYCLTSESEVAACFACVRAHLHPGGMLAFDAYDADAMHAEAAGIEEGDTSEPEFLVSVEVDGKGYTVLESSTWQPSRQLLEAHYDYLPEAGGPALRDTIRQRYLLRHQLEPLLRAAGFGEVAVFGDFADGPVDDESDLLVVRAR
jgi:SAM-dependent methyltransferase